MRATLFVLDIILWYHPLDYHILFQVPRTWLPSSKSKCRAP